MAKGVKLMNSLNLSKAGSPTLYKSIILVGDSYGIPVLLKYVPRDLVKGIVGASIRPQYIDELAKISQETGVKFLLQPKYHSSGYPGLVEQIASLKPDLLICNSYSMIIREDILALVKYNAINIHEALLPKNRGANPVQWAIIKGEAQTGVTMHYLDNGIDSGDIIAQRKVAIDLKDNWCSLKSKLSVQAEYLIKEEIPAILSGQNERLPQDSAAATYNQRLTPASPRIDFKVMSDLEVYNLIRAQVKPLSGAYLEHNGQKVYFSDFVGYEKIKELREKYAC